METEKHHVSPGKATGFLVFVIIFLVHGIVSHAFSILLGPIISFFVGIGGDPVLIHFFVTFLIAGMLLGIGIAISIFLLICAIILRRKWLITYAFIDVASTIGLAISGTLISFLIPMIVEPAMVIAMVSLINGVILLVVRIVLYVLLLMDAGKARIIPHLPLLLVVLVTVAFVLGPLLRFMLAFVSIEIIPGSTLDIWLYVSSLLFSTGITALLVAHFLVIHRGLVRESRQAGANQPPT